MKRNNNYQCSNIATETYTGKEASPKGMGFSAVPYELGFEKQGADNQIWVVQMKNGKKVWFRKSGMPSVNITHEEPLITDNNKSEPLQPPPLQETVINNTTTPVSASSEPEIKEEKEQKTTKQTDYNLFHSYYSKKLKEENIEKKLNKKPKEIQNETIAEWNRLKKNKKELEEILIIIKK
jgi:hypothetical protein